MKNYILSLVALTTLLAVSPSFAGDAKAGEAKAKACFSCHGAEGSEPIQPAWPVISGQNAEYLELALKDYKAGKRTGANSRMMVGMVASLSDDDIANLAAYFSSVE